MAEVFTESYKKMLQDTHIMTFKCQKCSYELGYFSVLDNLNLTLRQIKDHIRSHTDLGE